MRNNKSDLDGFAEYGEGWYEVHYSDGGQQFTNDGAVWCEDYDMYFDLMRDAEHWNTENHIAYSVYLGIEL